jgi:hypothetical protein
MLITPVAGVGLDPGEMTRTVDRTWTMMTISQAISILSLLGALLLVPVSGIMGLVHLRKASRATDGWQVPGHGYPAGPTTDSDFLQR